MEFCYSDQIVSWVSWDENIRGPRGGGAVFHVYQWIRSASGCDLPGFHELGLPGDRRIEKSGIKIARRGGQTGIAPAGVRVGGFIVQGPVGRYLHVIVQPDCAYG